MERPTVKETICIMLAIAGALAMWFFMILSLAGFISTLK